MQLVANANYHSSYLLQPIYAVFVQLKMASAEICLKKTANLTRTNKACYQ